MESPQIKYASNYTSSTAQKGVEAKEIEIANARLDVVDVSTSTQLGMESCTRDCDERAVLDDTTSYLQVVVEKHRRKQDCAAVAVQTSTRLPSASSPNIPNAENKSGERGRGAGDGGAVLWAAPVLMPRAALPTLRTADPAYCCPRCGDAPWPAEKRPRRDSAANEHVEPDVRPLLTRGRQKKKWDFFQDLYSNSLCDEGPERVEVYHFEHGSGEYLAASSGPRPSRCEAAARRGVRAGAGLAAALLAGPRALLALPVALLLHVQRCSLDAAREAAAGCALAASDLVLKPALALTFNALVQPALVCARHVLQAAREALRPAALALADVLEPAARLLAAVRLVHVHVAPACTCTCATAPHAPHASHAHI